MFMRQMMLIHMGNNVPQLHDVEYRFARDLQHHPGAGSKWEINDITLIHSNGKCAKVTV